MPGIAGAIEKASSEGSRQAVEAMVKCMRHEPFYTSGTYANETLGLQFGWTSLRGSFADCLPIWNAQKNICLIFSGEVFPEGEEKGFLKSKRRPSETGNASYLVHLYEELGLDFLKNLNGWFSGLLVDVREGRIFLFNDRYGMERIYFHETAEAFYFASEAKSLLKVLPQTRELDWRSFGEFLTCSCVLQNRTLFSGISLLPGGSLWTFAKGLIWEKGAYFSKDSLEKRPELTKSEYFDAFRAAWKKALPRYFQPGERAALSLTGGVDSRMMIAWINAEPGALPCYTWGSRYRDCWDVRLARQVAGICRQPHQTIPLNGTFTSDFPELAERAVYISDGTADATGAIDMYLQRVARDIAPVRLSGANGGELLRQKVSFKASPLPGSLFEPELLQQTEKAVTTYDTELADHKVSFCVFKQAPWYMWRVFSLERSQLILRTPYLDNDLVALTYQAPPDCRDIFFALRLVSEGNPALANIATDRGITLKAGLGTAKLRHLFQQFTFKAEYAFDSGMPQWLARLDHSLAVLHLEKLFMGRHKTYHFRVWCRDELAGYIKEILLDNRTLSRPYLRKGPLEKMVQDHLGSIGNYTDEIIRLLTTELVQRTLLEQN